MAAEELDGLLERARARGRLSVGERFGRLRSRGWQVGQCAIAAGVAWYLGQHLIGHPKPFFAPVAAVVSLGTSYGQRLRRVVEVTIGVALGVLMGDLITHVIGTGAWQLVVLVSLAMTIALLLDAGTIFVNQAAVQGIIVSTLLPTSGYALTRWTDALLGGAVAVVAASVVPRAPLRRPRVEAAGVVGTVASLLRAAADCIVDGDVDRAVDVLAQARRTEPQVSELRAAASEGLSVLASSPFRRRHRGDVRQMADLVEPLDYALRNTRVLVRRVAVAAYRREAIPEGYARLCRDLAVCAEEMATELTAGHLAEGARASLVALAAATSAVDREVGLNAEVVLAQLRSIVADLLAVSGMDPVAAMDALPPLR